MKLLVAGEEGGALCEVEWNPVEDRHPLFVRSSLELLQAGAEVDVAQTSFLLNRPGNDSHVGERCTLAIGDGDRHLLRSMEHQLHIRGESLRFDTGPLVVVLEVIEARSRLECDDLRDFRVGGDLECNRAPSVGEGGIEHRVKFDDSHCGARERRLAGVGHRDAHRACRLQDDAQRNHSLQCGVLEMNDPLSILGRVRGDERVMAGRGRAQHHLELAARRCLHGRGRSLRAAPDGSDQGATDRRSRFVDDDPFNPGFRDVDRRLNLPPARSQRVANKKRGTEPSPGFR